LRKATNIIRGALPTEKSVAIPIRGSGSGVGYSSGTSYISPKSSTLLASSGISRPPVTTTGNVIRSGVTSYSGIKQTGLLKSGITTGAIRTGLTTTTATSGYQRSTTPLGRRGAGSRLASGITSNSINRIAGATTSYTGALKKSSVIGTTATTTVANSRMVSPSKRGLRAQGSKTYVGTRPLMPGTGLGTAAIGSFGGIGRMYSPTKTISNLGTGATIKGTSYGGLGGGTVIGSLKSRIV